MGGSGVGSDGRTWNLPFWSFHFPDPAIETRKHGKSGGVERTGSTKLNRIGAEQKIPLGPLRSSPDRRRL